MATEMKLLFSILTNYLPCLKTSIKLSKGAFEEIARRKNRSIGSITIMP